MSNILKPRPILGWGLTLVWAGLIFWLSSSAELPGGVALPSPLDKLAHAGAFGLLTVFLHIATGRAWLALLLASLYGIGDEVHQALVPGRSSDPLDWAADTLGALAAVAAVGFLTQRGGTEAEKARNR